LNAVPITAYYPGDASITSQRLWRRGVKRFAKLAFLSDSPLTEVAVSPEELATLATRVKAAPGHAILAASLWSAPEKGVSFLAPGSVTSLSAAGGLPADEAALALPSMAYWAFAAGAKMPERMLAEEKASKPFRAMFAFQAEVAKPRERTARAQAFMEFMKWELAELLDELVTKHHVHWLCREANTDQFWDFYDITLRSRKPELIRLSFNTTVDEQLGLAHHSQLVLTDVPELAMASAGAGKKVVLLGGTRTLPQSLDPELSPTFLHLPYFSSQAPALRALAAAEPYKKRPAFSALSEAEAKVRTATDGGTLVIHA
jgi:hypothetical protein